MKSKTISQLKSELKALAESIKIHRKNSRSLFSQASKQTSSNYSVYAKLQGEGLNLFYTTANESDKYRHLHIAYCLMRGRKMEQIEKPRKGNEPDQAQIDYLVDMYTKLIEQEKSEEKSEEKAGENLEGETKDAKDIKDAVANVCIGSEGLTSQSDNSAGISCSGRISQEIPQHPVGKWDIGDNGGEGFSGVTIESLSVSGVWNRVCNFLRT